MTEQETTIQPVPDNILTAITPMSMLDRAITSGAGVEVLERLMGLQERWQANEARIAFSGALAGLRNDLPQIVKSQQVKYGNTNYSYEDLAEVVEQVSGPMAQHSLSFRWRTDSDTPGYVKVTCILEHADGHSEETTLAGPYDDSGQKNSIQAIGSVVTYLQRYTLKAALGIAAARDDDGRHGAPQGQPPPQRPAQRRKPPAQAMEPDDARAPSPVQDWGVVYAKLRSTMPEMLNQTQFGKAMQMLELPEGALTEILGQPLADYMELNDGTSYVEVLETVLTALEIKLQEKQGTEKEEQPW